MAFGASFCYGMPQHCWQGGTEHGTPASTLFCGLDAAALHLRYSGTMVTGDKMYSYNSWCLSLLAVSKQERPLNLPVCSPVYQSVTSGNRTTSDMSNTWALNVMVHKVKSLWSHFCTLWVKGKVSCWSLQQQSFQQNSFLGSMVTHGAGGINHLMRMLFNRRTGIVSAGLWNTH